VVNKKQCSLKVWTEEGSKFKASIIWDHPCCPIYRKYYSYACVLLDNHRDYNLAIDILFPCHLWVVYLGSYC
jgi:hypothetical protein